MTNQMNEQLSIMNLSSRSITSLEDLSNEIFYEIFEYLTGIDIYEVFSDLNIRFQSLVFYSSQRLKIVLDRKCETIQESIYEKWLIPNKDRIVSLRFANMSTMTKFFQLIPMNSSLSSLESLDLHGITSHQITASYNSLMSLPRLFSLIVQIDDIWRIQGVYQFLFLLPVLKYCKVSSKSDIKDGSLTWSSAKDIHSESIQHLIMDHDLTINQLICTLSCTPGLCYLNCKSLRTSYGATTDVPLNLPNLKCISINNDNASFNELEMFFKAIHSHIEILRFKASNNIEYVDADRWQRLISSSMPHLHTFYLQCSIDSHDRFPSVQEHEKSNGFTSSFWIERQWIFDFKIELKNDRYVKLVYSIHPQRKRWYDSFEHVDNDRCSSQFISHNAEQLVLTTKKSRIDDSSIRFLQSTEIILTGHCSNENYQSFISKRHYLFRNMQIHRLNIDNYEPSKEFLNQLLHVFPHIDALRISSFPTNSSNTIHSNETKKLDFISNNNNLTKVVLEKIDELKILHFLFMNLWTRIQYLQLVCTKNVNIEMVIRLILTKYTTYTPQLGALCLCLTYLLNDLIVEQLRTIIDRRKLLDNYTIKYINNKLYLQWK